MAGGMECQKNKAIEEWGAKREVLEKSFRFNRRTLPLALMFGLALPFLVYNGAVSEFVSSFTSSELDD